MSRLAPFFRNYDDYEGEVLLGKGSCGEVYRVKEKSTGNLVAQKRIYTISNPGDQKSFIREILVPLQLNLPGIVKMLGFRYPEITENADEGRGALIITELMKNGSLGDAMEKWFKGEPPKGFGPTEISKCIFGVAATMAQVHEKGAIHRDLKPGNVFLDDVFEPRIADFGLAKMVANSLENTLAIGSPLFMAPELYSEDEKYDISVDVYAYGVLLYQMFSNAIELDDNLPTRRPAQMIMRIVNGVRLKYQPTIPANFWKLITQCWNHAPVKRPRFSEIVEQMKAEPFVIKGTNMDKYREYQERICRTEVVDVPITSPFGRGSMNDFKLTVEKLAAGNKHFAELLKNSKAALESGQKQLRRYDFFGKKAKRP